jgi:restriction endonuclease Mrr
MIPKAGEIETQLREQYGDGTVYEVRRVIDELADHFQLSPQELAESDGSHLRFEHKVHSALARHCKLKLLVRSGRGSFRYVPEKLAEYEPHHHPPRPQQTSQSHHKQLSGAEARLLRRLKRKRRALTLAIRELEQGS